MPSAPLLEFKDVSFEAAGCKILDRVNWTMREDEHWVLLGPNGSGKTTLLRLATGFLWPNAGGSIWRCGQKCIDLRSLRQSIGWVASHLVRAVPPEESAIETVLSGRFAQWGLRPASRSQLTRDDHHRAALQMEQLGITSITTRPFGQLSQGEQQRVLIARARMADPLLILLDEPCAGLDPGGRERLLEDLNVWLADPDAPRMVFVTHHVEEIIPPMGHTLVLDRGKIVRCGATDQVVNASLLSDVFQTAPCRIEVEDGRYWPIWGDRKRSE